MPPATQSRPMPRKKKEPQAAADDPKTTTKVFLSVIRQAKTVASYRGIDLFDYLDSVLKPAVSRDFNSLFNKESRG
jgi:hypothetical protein